MDAVMDTLLTDTTNNNNTNMTIWVTGISMRGMLQMHNLLIKNSSVWKWRYRLIVKNKWLKRCNEAENSRPIKHNLL